MPVKVKNLSSPNTVKVGSIQARAAINEARSARMANELTKNIVTFDTNISGYIAKANELMEHREGSETLLKKFVETYGPMLDLIRHKGSNGELYNNIYESLVKIDETYKQKMNESHGEAAHYLARVVSDGLEIVKEFRGQEFMKKTLERAKVLEKFSDSDIKAGLKSQPKLNPKLLLWFCVDNKLKSISKKEEAKFLSIIEGLNEPEEIEVIEQTVYDLVSVHDQLRMVNEIEKGDSREDRLRNAKRYLEKYKASYDVNYVMKYFEEYATEIKDNCIKLKSLKHANDSALIKRLNADSLYFYAESRMAEAKLNEEQYKRLTKLQEEINVAINDKGRQLGMNILERNVRFFEDAQLKEYLTHPQDVIVLFEEDKEERYRVLGLFVKWGVPDQDELYYRFYRLRNMLINSSQGTTTEGLNLVALPAKDDALLTMKNQGNATQ